MPSSGMWRSVRLIYTDVSEERVAFMKNAVFWDVAQCAFNIHRRFGGTCFLHFQGRRNNAREGKVLNGC
jgi:hypothetical protein